jgi:transposase-like protein
VDKQGFTVDFYLSRRRDVEAAKQLLRKAMKNQRVPTKIRLDAYTASHRAVAELIFAAGVTISEIEFHAAVLMLWHGEWAEKV